MVLTSYDSSRKPFHPSQIPCVFSHSHSLWSSVFIVDCFHVSRMKKNTHLARKHYQGFDGSKFNIKLVRGNTPRTVVPGCGIRHASTKCARSTPLYRTPSTRGGSWMRTEVCIYSESAPTFSNSPSHGPRRYFNYGPLVAWISGFIPVCVYTE